MLPIEIGALVLLENAQGAAGYFLGPGGGGITVEHNRLEITVITAASPLGKQLLKRREGEVFLMETGAHRDQTIITAVI